MLAAERGEKEVLGLDVAVHDAALVGLAEGARGLTDDVNGARRRQRTEARDVLGERLALQELHHVVPEAVFGGAVVEDADRVGVRELRGGVDLALEAREGARRSLACSGRRIFTATSRLRPGWYATQTSPMPPVARRRFRR